MTLGPSSDDRGSGADSPSRYARPANDTLGTSDGFVRHLLAETGELFAIALEGFRRTRDVRAGGRWRVDGLVAVGALAETMTPPGPPPSPVPVPASTTTTSPG